jgi:hypothetical protein
VGTSCGPCADPSSSGNPPCGVAYLLAIRCGPRKNFIYSDSAAAYQDKTTSRVLDGTYERATRLTREHGQRLWLWRGCRSRWPRTTSERQGMCNFLLTSIKLARSQLIHLDYTAFDWPRWNWEHQECSRAQQCRPAVRSRDS